MFAWLLISAWALHVPSFVLMSALLGRELVILLLVFSFDVLLKSLLAESLVTMVFV